jgi:hypothetical protein
MADDDGDTGSVLAAATDDGLTVQLRRPVRVQDKGNLRDINELHFRPPVAGDVFKSGYPLTFISTRVGVETRIDEQKMQRLLYRVCDFPDAVDIIDLGAMQSAFDWITGEFNTVARLASDGTTKN